MNTATPTPAPAETCSADCPSALSPIADWPDLTDKINRLPKVTRDMVNLMLDDGLPYHIIIDELAESGCGLTPQRLTKWLQSGYEDYLKNRQDIEQAKSQMEFATDLLRELGDTDPSLIYRACSVLVAHQMFNAVQKYGDAALSDILRANPVNYLRLLNTFCNMTDSTLKLQEHRISLESRQKAAEATDAGLPLRQGC